MSTQARSRIKRHEPERLGLRRFDNFPNVDAERMTGQSHFISQSDIHASKGVFQELYHFGAIGRGNRQRLLDELLIKQNRYLGASRSDSSDDFGDVTGRVVLIAGIDALRR